MSKAHRGAGILDKPNHGRGKCPVCKRTGVKVLQEQEINGTKYNICKPCKAAIAHGKKQEAVSAL